MLDALAYFFVTAVLYTLPVSVVIWLMRRRLRMRAAAALMAVSFGAATAYTRRGRFRQEPMEPMEPAEPMEPL